MPKTQDCPDNPKEVTEFKTPPKQIEEPKPVEKVPEFSIETFN